jgi:hypothetical protein
MELANLYESGCVIPSLGNLTEENSSVSLHFPQTYGYRKYDENVIQ